jgi:hypothetical protein
MEIIHSFDSIHGFPICSIHVSSLYLLAEKLSTVPDWFRPLGVTENNDVINRQHRPTHGFRFGFNVCRFSRIVGTCEFGCCNGNDVINQFSDLNFVGCSV